MNKHFLSANQVLLPGIYGGMGPMSHIKFEEHLVKISKELTTGGDQSIPVWLLINGSSTPDRTLSIQHTGLDAKKHLSYFCMELEKSKCDFIILICNTAHKYINYLKQRINIPFVSMIEETCNEIGTKYKEVCNIGILGTTGTLNTNLYQDCLKEKYFKTVILKTTSQIQREVMEAIYNPKIGIKYTSEITETAKQKLLKAYEWYTKNGAEVLVSGCTEISLAFENLQLDVPIVDPLKITAYKTVGLAMGVNKLKPVEMLELNTPKYLNTII